MASRADLLVRPPLTLADVAVPGRGALRDALLVVGFIVVNALLAQVSILLPGTPVPMTLQTLAVRLTGGLLGSRLGAITMLGYLLAGSLSLPVFAGGAGGAERLVGPTAGYLVGFVVSAWMMGHLTERGWDRRFGRGLAAMALASLPIYTLGVVGLWLALPDWTFATVLERGLLWFLPGDALKLLVGAGLLAWGWRAVEWIKRV